MIPNQANAIEEGRHNRLGRGTRARLPGRILFFSLSLSPCYTLKRFLAAPLLSYMEQVFPFRSVCARLPVCAIGEVTSGDSSPVEPRNSIREISGFRLRFRARFLILLGTGVFRNPATFWTILLGNIARNCRRLLLSLFFYWIVAVHRIRTCIKLIFWEKKQRVHILYTLKSSRVDYLYN